MVDQHKMVKSRVERDREDAEAWRSLIALIELNRKKACPVVVTRFPSNGQYFVRDYYNNGAISSHESLAEAIREAYSVGLEWSKGAVI